MVRSVVFVCMLASAVGACAKKQHTIAGTRIPDTAMNQDVIKVLETYRNAVESGDAKTLLLLASENYREDGGTPSIADDYGYEGLKEVLASRFQRVSDVRYSLRYQHIRRECPSEGRDLTPGCLARVEVLVDASFTVKDMNDSARRPDKRDQNELVLEWTGDKWLIVAGM